MERLRGVMNVYICVTQTAPLLLGSPVKHAVHCEARSSQPPSARRAAPLHNRRSCYRHFLYTAKHQHLPATLMAYAITFHGSGLAQTRCCTLPAVHHPQAWRCTRSCCWQRPPLRQRRAPPPSSPTAAQSRRFAPWCACRRAAAADDAHWSLLLLLLQLGPAMMFECPPPTLSALQAGRGATHTPHHLQEHNHPARQHASHQPMPRTSRRCRATT